MPRSQQGGCMHVGPVCGKGAAATPAAGKAVCRCCPHLTFHCLLSPVGYWLLSEVGFWSSRAVAFTLALWRCSCVYPHQGNCQTLQPCQSSSGKLVAQHSCNPEFFSFFFFFPILLKAVASVLFMCLNPFSQLGF